MEARRIISSAILLVYLFSTAWLSFTHTHPLFLDGNQETTQVYSTSLDDNALVSVDDSGCLECQHLSQQTYSSPLSFSFFSFNANYIAIQPIDQCSIDAQTGLKDRAPPVALV